MKTFSPLKMDHLQITQEQIVVLVLKMEMEERYHSFLEAYEKLCTRSGYPIAQITPKESTLTVKYVGRLDTLCTINYISGAFVERAYLTKTAMKPN